jgi:hypothetical protein
MVDRVINYVGAVPLDVDLLNTNKNLMIGLGFALQAILGGSTVVDGLACTPTGPASLQVLVAQGSIYSTENVEGTAFGSLGSDTSHQILKQGITALGNTAFTCAAPSTSGQSIAYLIQGQYQDVDAGSVVLPYYNASNPAVAYNGPANSGTSQNTVRQGKLILNLKAGTSATTGTQVTPTPDAGFTGLWVVTVANGITAITSGMIALYPGAPFINYKLPQLSPSGPSGRTALSGSTTYYVSTTGSDSSGNGTSGLPWATMQHAATYIQQNVDLAGYTATVNVANGTYSSGVQIFGPLTGASGATSLLFLGNPSSPSSCVISVTSANAFAAQQGATFTVNGFEVAATGSGVFGNGLYAASSSYISYLNMNYGTCGSSHIYATDQAYIQPNAAATTQTISAGAATHIRADNHGIADEGGQAVTLTGTPAFSSEYALATNLAVIDAVGTTYSGAATGIQYSATGNAVINTSGATTNWPTGLTSGSTGSGGQII